MTKPNKERVARFFKRAPALCLCVVSLFYSPLLLAYRGSSSLTRLQRHAQELRDADRLSEATQAYSMALAVSPGWSDGWWQLGTIAYDLDDYAKSREAFHKYLALKPQDGSAWAMKGLAEFELKDFSRSLADLQHARTLGITSENHLDAISSLHELLLENQIGDFAKAFSLVKTLCATTPVSTLTIVGTGLTALRMSLLPDQIPADQRPLVRMTGDAVCDASGNRSASAQEHFVHLVEQYSGTPEVHYLYGCFILKDHPDEGLTQLRQELVNSPSHEPAMTQIAQELLRRGDPQQAQSYAERSVKLSPTSAQAHYALGRALVDQKQVADGILHLQRAMAIAPSNRGILWALASAYAEIGNVSAARRIRLRLTSQTDE